MYSFCCTLSDLNTTVSYIHKYQGSVSKHTQIEIMVLFVPEWNDLTEKA